MQTRFAFKHLPQAGRPSSHYGNVGSSTSYYIWRRPYLDVALFARLTRSTGFAGVWHNPILDWRMSSRVQAKIYASFCWQACCGNSDVEGFIPCFCRISNDSMTVGAPVESGSHIAPYCGKGCFIIGNGHATPLYRTKASDVQLNDDEEM